VRHTRFKAGVRSCLQRCGNTAALLEENAMRLLAELMIAAAFRRFWRRRLVDQYALLIADIGLTRAEQDVLLTLRAHR
jgi:hypothetical protein